MDDLLKRLKAEASIETSEGFDDELDLTVDIEEAIERHNSSYTADTLPDNEVQLVMLLAWAKICYRRAAKFAKEANSTGGQGFASDRTTPYNKCINLAEMLEKRYRASSDNLGITTSGTSIVVGSLVKFDTLINQITPRSQGAPPNLRLFVAAGESVSDGDTIILQWDTREYQNFDSFILFTTNDGNRIYELQNQHSATGYPRVRDSAVKVITITDCLQRAIIISNIDKTVQNNFLMLNKSASERYSYSNELLIGGS